MPTAKKLPSGSWRCQVFSHYEDLCGKDGKPVIDEKTEDLLLDEIGRTQSYLEKQIAEVKKNVDELNQYYRITRLENDNTALLLKMIESLQKDVEELKKKTA